MRPAILKGWYFVPYEAVGGDVQLDALKSQLTVTPKPGVNGEREPFFLFKDLPAKQRIGVPMAFGRHRWPWLEVEDLRTDGPEIECTPTLPDPYHESVREPELQQKFMFDLEDAVVEREHFIACAPTGSGKTICGLRTAVVRGRKTLIVVHLERLLSQWIEESMVPILGIPRERIGIVGGGKQEWRDKDFVVAMLQSVSKKRYPKAFYESFGTVIFDEVHKIGAPVFSRAAPLFNARVRFGLSATPTRKQGGDEVFMWHLGPVRARSKATALPCKVFVIRYTCQDPKRRLRWAKTREQRIKALSLDPARNNLIADYIKRMYDKDRTMIVVCESVKHAQKLRQLSVSKGVPREITGQFTGIRYTYKNGREKKEKISKELLDMTKKQAKIIFATYGMITEGIDIPRLDAGIDATPRGSATQLVGRIRRPHPGKKHPAWVTFVDTECKFSQRFFKSRCKDYRSSGCEIMEGVR